MATLLTKDDARHLANVVRLRARTVRKEIASRAAAMAAEYERQAGDVGTPVQDQILAQLYMEAGDRVVKANQAIQKRADDEGLPRSWAPVFAVKPLDAAMVRAHRAEAKKLATARLAALKGAALAEVERVEAHLLEELHTSLVLDQSAHAWLAALPTADALMPDALVTAQTLKGVDVAVLR
jgi:hypothetical protein